MRILVAASLFVALAFEPAQAARRTYDLPTSPVSSVTSAPQQDACRGCGCRGGAGYRLANGKCAPRSRG